MPGEQQAPSPGDQDTRPVPDPTALTTAALFREIAHLKELVQSDADTDRRVTNERFARVDGLLDVAERHRVEQKMDTKTNIDDALTAQKGAATKTEANFTKQFEQITTTFNVAIAGLTTQVSDLKDRVNTSGGGQQGKDRQLATLIAAGGLLFSIIAVTLGVVLALTRN